MPNNQAAEYFGALMRDALAGGDDEQWIVEQWPHHRGSPVAGTGSSTLGRMMFASMPGAVRFAAGLALWGGAVDDESPAGALHVTPDLVLFFGSPRCLHVDVAGLIAATSDAHPAGFGSDEITACLDADPWRFDWSTLHDAGWESAAVQVAELAAGPDSPDGEELAVLEPAAGALDAAGVPVLDVSGDIGAVSLRIPMRLDAITVALHAWTPPTGWSAHTANVVANRFQSFQWCDLIACERSGQAV